MPNWAGTAANMVPIPLRPLAADQLKALGQLAAGVAHEIRNPLTSIKLLVQTLQEDRAARSAHAKDFQIIEQEIRRIERCVETLLDYAQPAPPQFRPLDLGQQVGLVLAVIAERARKQRVKVEFTPAPAPMMVMGDFEQLHHLLLNLMLNALDAMRNGGRLVVVLNEAGAGEMELRVLDTGPGIATKLLPALFQPFISTKEKGLGLGLATSRHIAETHGGNLSAENRPEGGACFILRLPALEQG
jgi:two-component system, NtrC family, sensor histidine kinase HydH